MKISLDQFIDRFFGNMFSSLGISRGNQLRLLGSVRVLTKKKVEIELGNPIYQRKENKQDVLLAVVLAACNDVAETIISELKLKLDPKEVDILLEDVRANLISASNSEN